MELLVFQHGTLRFVGFDVLPTQVSYSPTFADQAAREGMLKKWEARLDGIWEEATLVFPPTGDFEPCVPGNPYGGLKLKQELVDKASHGASPAIHLGKPVPESYYVKSD